MFEMDIKSRNVSFTVNNNINVLIHMFNVLHLVYITRYDANNTKIILQFVWCESSLILSGRRCTQTHTHTHIIRKITHMNIIYTNIHICISIRFIADQHIVYAYYIYIYIFSSLKTFLQSVSPSYLYGVSVSVASQKPPAGGLFTPLHTTPDNGHRPINACACMPRSR